MESNTKEIIKEFIYNGFMVFFGIIITVMVSMISLMAVIVLGPFGGLFTFGMCLATILTIMKQCSEG